MSSDLSDAAAGYCVAYHKALKESQRLRELCGNMKLEHDKALLDCRQAATAAEREHGDERVAMAYERASRMTNIACHNEAHAIRARGKDST